MDCPVIKKDITSITRGIICHQVNCQGVMGAGLAKKLASKYPQVKQEYLKLYDRGELKLGITQLVKINPELYIANLAGQDNYGVGKVQTDYNALRKCLNALAFHADDLPIYIPYKLGCGLAGGNWDTVLALLHQELKHKEWYICKLP